MIETTLLLFRDARSGFCIIILHLLLSWASMSYKPHLFMSCLMSIRLMLGLPFARVPRTNRLPHGHVYFSHTTCWPETPSTFYLQRVNLNNASNSIQSSEHSMVNSDILVVDILNILFSPLEHFLVHGRPLFMSYSIFGLENTSGATPCCLQCLDHEAPSLTGRCTPAPWSPSLMVETAPLRCRYSRM